MTKLAGVLNRLSGGRLNPSAITLVGFVMHIPIAWLIATRHNLWAAGLLVFFGLFDALDGALARVQKREGPKGMLLDSVTDKIKEVFLYLGVGYALIVTGGPYLVLWAVAACGASLLVSYVNAWGEVVLTNAPLANHQTNRSFRTGLMTFEIRMFVLVLGLLTNHLATAVIFIAIAAALTALERFVSIYRKL